MSVARMSWYVAAAKNETQMKVDKGYEAESQC